jgi:hypothetical protein
VDFHAVLGTLDTAVNESLNPFLRCGAQVVLLRQKVGLPENVYFENHLY